MLTSNGKDSINTKATLPFLRNTNLSSAENILIPTNEKNNHWWLIWIAIKEGIVFGIDSSRFQHKGPSPYVAERLKLTVKWLAELRQLDSCRFLPIFKFRFLKHTPLQTNSWDCGIMMILAAESIARGTITKTQHMNQIPEFSINCFECSDTPSVRAQIVESIIFLDPCPLISRRRISISSPLVDYSMILGNQQLKPASPPLDLCHNADISQKQSARSYHDSNNSNSNVTIDSTLLHELETSCRANCGLEPLSTNPHKKIYDHCSLSDCHGNSVVQETTTTLTNKIADDDSYRMVYSSYHRTAVPEEKHISSLTSTSYDMS